MSGTSGSEADRSARKRRRKTFSGCWTCRAKHVKCDEAKPACRRCQRSGLECEGYGIRLSWAIQRDPSNFTSTRSTRGGTGRTQVPFGSERSRNIGPASSPQTAHNGPVAVDSEPRGEENISVQGNTPQTPSVPPSVPAGHDCHPPAASPPPDRDSTRWRSATDSALSPWSLQQQWPMVESSATRVPADDPSPRPFATTPGSNPAFVTANSNPYADISWLPTYDGDSPASLTHQPEFQEATREGVRHLEKLADPGLQCEILEHWTLVLCDLLAPIPDFNNPLKTIFTSLALEGAREDVSVSTGAVALFHLICSASGFHLSKLERVAERSRAFGNMALEHHNLGIMHLSRNIRSDDKCQRVAILASLIICLYHESITLYDPRWRLHIKGAVEWVNHVGPGFWHKDESASVIYQMYMAMAILIQSQILPWDRTGCGGPLQYDIKEQQYTLDSIFGVPQSVLQAVYTMNRIQQCSPGPTGLSEPRLSGELSHDLQRLEMELLLMAPSKVRDSVPVSSAQMQFHHENIFYYAAIVYLKRTLRNTPVKDVQALVRRALDHIEALQAASAERVFSPLVWPIAIIAFETQDSLLQDRMMRCLEVFNRSPALAIWKKFSESVQGLWAKRQSQGEENLCWHAYSPLFYRKYMLV